MTGWPARRKSALLALLLLIVGAALVFLGLRDLWPGGRAIPATPTATASALSADTGPTLPPSRTPTATATEPILPPPPTDTQAPTPLWAGTTAIPRPSTLASTASGSSPSPLSTVASTLAATSTPTQPVVTPHSPTLVPTPSPTAPRSPTPIPTIAPSASPTVLPLPTLAPPGADLFSPRARLGVCGGGARVDQALSEQLGFGWYLDWRVSAGNFRSSEVEYAPMIRLKDGQPRPSGDALLAAIDAMPGALWLIGNEPDVKWQDSVPPERYAQQYHDLYALIKGRDPAARVAIGGVSQPTPLRLRYLDSILQAYQTQYGEPMPVDIWNVHNFVLREERDSWGVDIPPGMSEDKGRLYEIADHDDMAIFRQQIIDFRRWMAERGQQDKPLIVTEYGILMPNDYGFSPGQVEAFMLDSFEFFRTAADAALGYPADGDRLVQRWCWYSLFDERYPTGNLLQGGGRQLTPLGEAFSQYAHTDR